MKRLLETHERERGATAVEYVMVVGLVSLLVIAAPVGLSDTFQQYCSGLVDTVGGLLGV